MNNDMRRAQIDTLMERMDHYLTIAIIFFCIAVSFLIVGVFITIPVSLIKIFLLCVSLPCAVISINYFIRYARVSKKISELSQ